MRGEVKMAAPARAWLTRWTPTQRTLAYSFIAVALLLAAGAILKPGILSGSSLRVIAELASFVGFVGVGQTLVFLVGGIDFSVVWVLNAAAILVVAKAAGSNANLAVALVLTLGVGIAVGLANGIGVAYFNIPAIVMTIGTNGIIEGLALGLSKGLTCSTCGAHPAPALTAALQGRAGGVPGVVLVWIGVILFISLLLSGSTFGRRIYATGVNPAASYLAGVGVKPVTVAVYVISGFFAAVAGIMLVTFGGGASLGLGDPYLLESIAAAVIGGVSVLGGRGHYIGTVAGSLALIILVTILNAEQIPEYARDIVYGAVIIVIVLLYGREKRSA
ncbi:MAG TPA: ABC transporter permease [Streptosporangiaceae bacterium]|nr:ABC transporter permease [Streptosporangiaceae bacterium]